MFLRLTSVLVLSATGLFAQNDFDLDKTSPGTLGSALDLAFEGAPNSTLGLIMLSFTAGPTAIAAFDPNDSRSVQVGLDLSSAWIFTLTSATGTGGYSLALPTDPSFSDLILHWQVAMLATSGPTIVGNISNDVVTQTSVAETGLFTQAVLGAARAFSAGFFDRDNNAGAGDYVVSGGGTGTLTSATGLSSTEVWDFRHMSVSSGSPMNSARALHLAVPLNDDRVLLIGGADDNGTVLASCEIYDPSNGSYTPTGSMSTARILHAGCLLNDGRVLVTAGTSSLADLQTTISSTLSSSEIFDPSTGTWSGTSAIGGRRLAPALSLLPNGNAMCSGGVQVGFFFGLPISAVSTTAVQFWNPNSGAWSGGPAMVQGRAGHHYNQVTLGNGRVVMTGGTFVPSLLGAANAAPLDDAEVYDPQANSWTASTMGSPRALHSANLLPDGRVAICGGAQGSLTSPSSIPDCELFDPTTNSWAAMPPLTAPRSGHASAMMPDGTLVLFGGQGATATTNTIETLRF